MKLRQKNEEIPPPGPKCWPTKCRSRAGLQRKSRHAVAAKGVCRRQISVMVKRITLFRIICFCLLAACAASSQSEPAVGEGLRGLQSRNIDGQRDRQQQERQPRGVRRLSPDAPLPDAPMPSTLEPAQFRMDSFRLPGTQPRLAFSLGAENTGLWKQGVFRQTQAADAAALLPHGATLFYDTPDRASTQKSSGFFLERYLYPPKLPQSSRYQASARDGLFGRATDAASRIFITQDLSGTRRLNTSYFLRVATLIAADTASRPYYQRHSGTAPLSDFGSTVGNDAGVNLLHEFGPSLHQAVTSHTPKFISRIEQRILQGVVQQGPNPHWRAANSSPGR